jgi:hypothetical protein
MTTAMDLIKFIREIDASDPYNNQNRRESSFITPRFQPGHTHIY